MVNVVDITKEPVKELHQVKIVQGSLDVFPENLPGLPPVREMQFEIELLPGTVPISKSSYRRAPLELQELKKQLQELIDKGFTGLCCSPW